MTDFDLMFGRRPSDKPSMPSEAPDRRLQDIIDNIDRITRYREGSPAGSELDAKTRDAIERCLQRISEAAKKLGSGVAEQHPSIPWRSIRGLGNVLRHEYDSVDDLSIDAIVREHLGPLRAACAAELARRKGARE